MGFMDKVMSKAQEVGKAGQAKVDEVQTKRHVDDLFRQVGALTYAARAGTAATQATEQLDRLFGQLQQIEGDHPELFTGPPAGPTPGSAGVPGSFSGPGGAPVAVVPTAFSGAGTVPGSVAAEAAARAYNPGAPAPANLYPPGLFALDELGYPRLDETLGVPIKSDGTPAEQGELASMGVRYPSPEDQRYWAGGMEPPW